MTALVVDIHDFFPVTLDPPRRLTEPATVIIMPIVRIERDHYVAKWKRDVRDDGLPSDCQ